MTRKTIGTARYGLIFHDGQTLIIYAVALVQALSWSAEKPRRVLVFERDRATYIDNDTLDKCWIKSHH